MFACLDTQRLLICPSTIPAVRANIKVLASRVKVIVNFTTAAGVATGGTGCVSVSLLWGLAGYGVLWLQCSVLVSAFVSFAAFWDAALGSRYGKAQ